jgi:hypothetical protein
MTDPIKTKADASVAIAVIFDDVISDAPLIQRSIQTYR